jgi:hypothetical protein
MSSSFCFPKTRLRVPETLAPEITGVLSYAPSLNFMHFFCYLHGLKIVRFVKRTLRRASFPPAPTSMGPQQGASLRV